MKKRFRILYWVGAVLAVLAGGGALGASSLAKWKIEKRYPGVTVGSVTFTRSGIRLHDVLVDRPNLKAHLRSVFSPDGKDVTLEGGDVTLTLGEKAKESTSSTVNVHGRLDAVSVSKEGVVAEATRVEFDSVRGCADSVLVTKEGLPSVHVDHACGLRDGTDITAKVVRVAVNGWTGDLPLEGLASQLQGGLPKDITLEDVHVQPKEKKASVEHVNAGAIQMSGVSIALSPKEMLIREFQLDVPRIHGGPLTLKAVRASGTPDELQLEVRGAHLHVRPHDMAVEGDESCETWVEALPSEMREGPLQSKPWEGRISFALQVKPEPKLSLKGTCKTSCAAFSDLRRQFTYTAYDAQGREFERTTGPKTSGWVQLQSMNPTMPLSVIALEDPGFRSHRGFIGQALENSLKDDVKLSRFARGGSTITMQLAKNLFLRRDKTLGRKAQELVIAMALEGCMSKDQILETYLNVVEFGPNMYGIKDAADKRFDEEPMELAPEEALYLASILPSPKKAPNYDEKTRLRIQGLARKLAESGRLPDDVVFVTDDWE